MKRKLVFVTLSLLLILGKGWAVETREAEPLSLSATSVFDYSSNELNAITDLELTGAGWNTAAFTQLMKALKGSELEVNTALQQVTVGDGCTLAAGSVSLSDLFRACKALLSATLPAPGIGTTGVDLSNLFYNCSSLTSPIDLSGFSNITGMSYAFWGCSNLTTVTMPTQENSTEMSFRGAFSACPSLTSPIDLSGFSNISEMNTAFSRCSNLTTVTMPTQENSAAVDFRSAFNACSSLTSPIDLSGFSNISGMDRTFFDCSKLTTVTMPTQANNTAVSFMSAFQYCAALTSPIDLSGFSNISGMNNTFYDCSKLTIVTMPTQANNTAVSFDYAFQNCAALTSPIDLSGFSNISGMNATFYDCSKLATVKLGTPRAMIANVEYSFVRANPNCLIYVPSDWTENLWTAAGNKVNLIVNDATSQGYTALGDIVLEEKNAAGDIYYSYHCPTAFKMAAGNRMSYTRSWTYATPTGGWNTLYLPFDATAETSGNKPLASVTAGADGDYWLKSLTGSENGTLTLGLASTVAANTPYLMALPGSAFDESSLEGQDVTFYSQAGATIPATPDVQSPQAGAYTLYGTYWDYQEFPLYLLTVGTGDAGDSFVQYTADAGVRPFRAYIKGNTSQANAALRLTVSNEDGSTTGLPSLRTQAAQKGLSLSTDGSTLVIESTKSGAITLYNLNGQVVRHITLESGTNHIDGLATGTYLVQGQKVTLL